MPFNSEGVYTPASGATSAAPGDIIQSSVWNAVFTDISSALTLLGQQLYGSTPISSAQSPYEAEATDTFILVSTATGAVTIDLMAASAVDGYPVAVKDSSGNANTNNITITANGSDTIEGSASITINTDYGGVKLYPVTGGWVLHP
jgi:hypothetical protein